MVLLNLPEKRGRRKKPSNAENQANPKTSNADFFSVGSGRRYYSPGLGRWVNRDPIGELGGINRYALVANSPIAFWDTLGLVKGEFRFEGITYSSVGDRYAISPATLTENSCECKKKVLGIFGCETKLRCRISVSAGVVVNLREHRVWNDEYDKLIAEKLFHEARHIRHYRDWYDSQREWISGFEITYLNNKLCMEAKKLVETRTQEGWDELYRMENRHSGPNWE